MVSTVIRPTWSPENDDQRKALAKAVRLAEAYEKAESAMWAAIVEARNLGVPDVPLTDATRQSRATLNRRYGPRSAADKAKPAE
jgi:hypothetical protein